MSLVELTSGDLRCSGCGTKLRSRTPGAPKKPGWQAIGRSVQPLKHRPLSKTETLIETALCHNCATAVTHSGIHPDSWKWPG